MLSHGLVVSRIPLPQAPVNEGFRFFQSFLWRGAPLKKSTPKQNIYRDSKTSWRFWTPQRNKSYLNSWSSQSQNPSFCIPFYPIPPQLSIQTPSSFLRVLSSFSSHLSFSPSFSEPKQFSLSLAEKSSDYLRKLKHALGVSHTPLQAQHSKAFLKCLTSAYDLASISSTISSKMPSTQ